MTPVAPLSLVRCSASDSPWPLRAAAALMLLPSASWCADADPATSSALAPVVVTAQKRAESADRVPAAMTVLSASELKRSGAASALDLGELAPNVQTERANGVQITMRGVTSPDGTEKGDPSVAFHVDGVYRARPQGLDGTFYDLERVEILRGPQGTLYGRNATGGVVNVISAKPRQRFEAAVAAELGDHQSRRVDGMLNLAPSEALALRLALLRKRRDSDLHNGQANPFIPEAGPGGDLDETAARLQLLLTPAAGTRLLLSADESLQKGGMPTRLPITQFYDISNPAAPQPVDRGSAARTNTTLAPLLPPLQRFRNQGTAATLTLPVAALDDAEFSYQWAHRQLQRNADGTQPVVGFVPGLGAVTVPIRARWPGQYSQQSHELRLASNDRSSGPWQWLLGLYAFSEDSSGQTYSYNPPQLAALLGVTPFYGFEMNPTHARSTAGFGQLSYRLAPDWRATLGARHTRDIKSRTGYTVFQQTEVFNPLTDFKALDQAAVSYSKTNWRAALEHDLDRHSLAWASLATGYKAGSFNDGCAAGTPGCLLPVPSNLLYYKPETLQALEAGVKGRWPEQRLRAQLSAFVYRYRDLQLNTIVNNSQLTRNAARAAVRGLELEATQGLGARDELDLGLAWLDARYKDFKPTAQSSPSTPIDWAGRQLDRSPRNRLSLAWRHNHALAQGARLEGGLNLMRSASYVISDTYVPTQYTQPAYTKWGAQLAYVAPGDAWRISAWGRNLGNKIVVTDVSPLGNVAIGETRRWGLGVQARF